MSDSVHCVLTARDAISRHIQWKITLQTAITLRERLTEEELKELHNYRSCLIGRWLDSDATLAFRADPVYLTLVSRHIEFHDEMQVIAVLIDAHLFASAELAIGPGSSFVQASFALASAITAFDRVVPIHVVPAPA